MRVRQIIKSFFAFCLTLFIFSTSLLSVIAINGKKPITVKYDFKDTINKKDIKTDGDSSVKSDSLILTSNNYDRSGSAFYKKRITLNDSGFSTYFVFNISDANNSKYIADGFSFVINPDNSHTNTKTALGGALGYSPKDNNVKIYTNSISVEFDIFDNSPYGTGSGDPGDPSGTLSPEQIKTSGNHISINANGKKAIPLKTTTNNITSLPDFKSGNDIHVWINYDSTASGDKLNIYTSYNTSRPVLPDLSADINIYDYLDTKKVFFGFTAACGHEGSALQVIKSWYLNKTFDSILMDGSIDYEMDTSHNSPGLDDVVNVTKNCGLIKVKNWGEKSLGENADLLENSVISIEPQEPIKFIIPPYVDNEGYLVFKLIDGAVGFLECSTKLLDISDNTIEKATGTLFIDVSDFVANVPLSNTVFNEKLDDILVTLNTPNLSQAEILDSITMYSKLVEKAPDELFLDSLSKIKTNLATSQSQSLQYPTILFELRKLAGKIIELTSNVEIPSSVFLGKTTMVVNKEKEDLINSKIQNNIKITKDINSLFSDINSFSKFESIMLLKVREGWSEEFSNIEVTSSTVKNLFNQGIENISLQTPNATIVFKKNTLSNMGNKYLVFESKDNSNQILSGTDTLKKYDLSLLVDDSTLTNTKDNFCLHLPISYEGTNENNLTVKRENDDSTVDNLGGVYNSSSEKMIVTANHFSVYYIFEINKGFSDQDSASWASKYISGLGAKGISYGDQNNKFFPNNFITREEFTSMVVSSFNLMDPTAQTKFQDVNKGQWFCSAISSAVKNGIIKGQNGNHFGVGNFVLRQDAATILSNALLKVLKINYPSNPENIILKYSDKDSIAAYAIPSVALLTAADIMKGDTAGNFMPATNITKAHASVIIFLALRLRASQGLPYLQYQEFVDVS